MPRRGAALCRGVAAIAIAVSLAACSVLRGPGAPEATEEERRAYAQALAALPDAPAMAQERLEAFVRTWPRSPLADDALVRLGGLAAARGDGDEALQWYYRVVREHPQAELADAARVRIAALELERGDGGAAAQVLSRARLDELPRDERREAFRILADTAPDAVSTLRWLARLRAEEIDEDRLALVDVRIDRLLRTLDAEALERAADQVGRQVPAARILLAAAERSLDRGELDRARRALDRAGRLPLAPQYATRLAAVGERLRLLEEGPGEVADLPTFEEVLRERLPSTAGARGTIGVVLPLSGPFARFGEESLHGVLLAAEIFGGADAAGDWEASGTRFGRGAPGDGPRVRVLIRDSEGRPERAAQAVRDLARNEDVAAIVGPLVKAECEAAAAEAEAMSIPLLALTAREEIARGRSHVFRTRTTPQEEVAVLVDHAMRALGARRFAILYPADAYGRGLRGLFWDEVERHGGSVVGVASYDPGATDFAEPIRRLVGYALLSDEQQEALEDREEMLRRARRLPPEEALAMRESARAMRAPDGELLPPIVDYDALFIPESHEKVVLIAPQLAFHEASGTRLLGPSGWYHPDLVEIGRDHVRDALFAAQFFPESTLPFVQRFAQRYGAAFGAPPDAFAAQAYDAANLVLVQLARGLNSREAVRDGILATRAYPGVTGVLSMRSDGNARKRPFLLAVERDRIVQVD